jgi:hypothetical protein
MRKPPLRKLAIEGRARRRIAGYIHRSSCPTGVAPSHEMLSRYSHIRMQVKWAALQKTVRRPAADKTHRAKAKAKAPAAAVDAPAATVAPTLAIQ